jgi:AcrR family transcriptional regulator
MAPARALERSTPAAPMRLNARRDALVRRVLDAALQLFAENGYGGTSVPDVMARAGVGAGSLYRLFESKEVLINAVFRDAKGRLQNALRADMPTGLPPRGLFDEFWARLVRFSRDEPIAFRFLELQHHVPYLDGESRQLELAVLAPVVVACVDFQRQGVFRRDVAPEVILSFVWGALVGLVKSEQLGYAKLGPDAFDAARDACWRAFALAETDSEERKQPWKRQPKAPKARKAPATVE